MRFREIVENVATTCSGSIAPVSMALGTQTRSGGSLLSGKYSEELTPNTPKEYQRNKNVSGRFKNSPGN
jgi:hypothetical protein